MAENINFKKLDKTLRESTEGLKDQVSYMKELGNLKNRYNRELAKGEKLEERVKDTLEDIVDKTKDIFKNRKALHEEQLTTVDLHKLERRLIAEGLEDQIKFVQKLKEEDRIQKQINRTVNAQAKIYNNIGSSIDSFVRMLPGGGFLGDLLGTGNLGKEMSESFRTELSQGGGLGEFGKNVGGEFGGGFLNSLFLRGGGAGTGTSKDGPGGVAKSKKAARRFFSGGLTSAFATTIAFAAATKLFSVSMAQGFQSQGLFQAARRFFFGGASEGIRAAFGTIARADFGTLFRLQLNQRRFGVTAADQAKILAAQVNITGLSQKSALNIQQSLASSAAMRGVLPEDVFADIASNTENFAAFAKDGGQNIGEAAIRARELGISLDTVFKVSDGILDFQSSIENELKASLLIGRQLNLNEARRLAMAGDMAGLQEEILRQVGSEEELQRMNAIQRKSLAGALGVTVQELNKLASGDLEVKNSDMKQNTSALTTLTFVMMAAAAATGLRLAGRGLAYGSQLISQGGFSNIMKQAPKGGIMVGDKFYKGGQYLPSSARIPVANAPGTIGATGLGVAARAGQVGMLIAAVAGITILVKKLLGSSEETAKNTKKSITGKNFSTPLMSATVMQGIGSE